ncbi:MAG: hypothetical protein IPG73_00895 [Ignavibacteria bacterium]|nr:hypothetical protein [Ignavibacteria bacterium]
MNFAYVDSTFIFGLYDDGTILSGPADARVQRTLLSPTASVFVPDTDTLLALDCGGLWLLPIGSDEPRTRIMTVSTDSRFVTAIDHGFALRRGARSISTTGTLQNRVIQLNIRRPMTIGLLVQTGRDLHHGGGGLPGNRAVVCR